MFSKKLRCQDKRRGTSKEELHNTQDHHNKKESHNKIERSRILRKEPHNKRAAVQ